ncbi:MAG: glycosyltransferase family 2 protein [Actinomycetota bacterium]
MSEADVGGGDRQVAVSVLVPTLNEEDHIERTVEGLLAQRFDGELEFLVIDGNSEDGTRRALERLARTDRRIRLLDNPHRGIPFALNIGLRHARGEFVARMDAHTLYPPDYLARGVEHLERRDIDWASGPAFPHGVDAWSSCVALALGTWLGTGGASFRRATREVEVDTGFTGILRRETLIRHGGWDEGWAVNEDSELAARIRESGGRIACVPEMAAGYVPRNSLGSLALQYWRYGQYRAKTCLRHPESMRRSHVLPPTLTLALAAAALPRRYGSRAPRAGLAVYAVALVGTALSRHSSGVRQAAALPLVLSTMHLAWGFGFIVGCARFGFPLRALLRLPLSGGGTTPSKPEESWEA